eukprot:8872293-Alexandrium_andersonii.AAC.1
MNECWNEQTSMQAYKHTRIRADERMNSCMLVHRLHAEAARGVCRPSVLQPGMWTVFPNGPGPAG